eukprot:SAG11_NODE_666_length_7841_cov_24.388272_6_plen_57_part_00
MDCTLTGLRARCLRHGVRGTDSTGLDGFAHHIRHQIDRLGLRVGVRNAASYSGAMV